MSIRKHSSTPIGLRRCIERQAILRSLWTRPIPISYHGTSIDDEHLWNPQLYLAPEVLRRRLELVRENECNVLPLATALRYLQAGELPPRSVAITFDDGAYDFYSRAFPLIESFSFPVTVYLTTYYSVHQLPVFDTTCSYLLWKGRGRTLRWPEVLGADDGLELSGGRIDSAFRRLWQYPIDRGFTATERDGLLRQLAELLDIDYESILKRRLLHIMNSAEVQTLAQKGVDFQLHTHRHGVSTSKALFAREIKDNKEYFRSLRISEPAHFCYPGGVHRPEFAAWLRELKVLSATTCEPGLAARESDAMFLPRFVDTSTATEDEFVSWLAGVAEFIQKGRYVETPGQFLEKRSRVPALAI
jgi:peptidoglycan/xylan/chitin deacetylase (PgdA/CDA1 family)